MAKRYATQSDAINQLLPPRSNSCCERASAFVAGKLNPQNAAASVSICSA